MRIVGGKRKRSAKKLKRKPILVKVDGKRTLDDIKQRCFDIIYGKAVPDKHIKIFVHHRRQARKFVPRGAFYKVC